MNWLLILITVLKFIGISLLIILALVVFILLVLLLCGIKYGVKGNYNNGLGESNGYVTWLFGLFRADFCYKDNKLDYNLSLFFVDLKKLIFNDKPEQKERAVTRSEPKAKAEEDRQVTIMSKQSEQKPKTDYDKKIKKTKRGHRGISVKKKRPEKKESLLDKLNNIITEYEPQKLFYPAKRFLRRFTKALGAKGGADIVFGLDDPSLTGFVLGGGSVISAFLPFRLNLNGNFEREYLWVKGSISGKTRVLALIIPIVRAVLEKPVWNVLMKLKG